MARLVPSVKVCWRALIAALCLINLYTLFEAGHDVAFRHAPPSRTVAAKPSKAHCAPHQCECPVKDKPLLIAGFTKAWSAHSHGGLGKHADNLYRRLAQRGHSVHVFTTAVRPQRTEDFDVYGRLVVHYCETGNPGNGADPTFQAWTRRAYDNISAEVGGFDMIHLESLPIRLLDFANVTVPVIPSMHGVMVDVLRETALQAQVKDTITNYSDVAAVEALSFWYTSQVNTFRQFFRYQVVLTERARLDLIRTYNMDPDRVVVIHHSMPVQKFQRSPELGVTYRQHWKVPLGPDVLVVGFAGLLAEIKGIDFMVAAIPAILALDKGKSRGSPSLALLGQTSKHRAAQRIRFVVAGSGTDEEIQRVVDLVALPACDGRAVYVGSVAPGGMPAFYSAINVFVDASVHQTGSNGVLIEAMLSRVVVVASDVGSVSMTSIPSPRHGFVFQPGNLDELLRHITAIASGEVDLEAIRDAAQRHAQAGFNLVDMVDRYEALFRHVVRANVTIRA